MNSVILKQKNECNLQVMFSADGGGDIAHVSILEIDDENAPGDSIIIEKDSLSAFIGVLKEYLKQCS